MFLEMHSDNIIVHLKSLHIWRHNKGTFYLRKNIKLCCSAICYLLCCMYIKVKTSLGYLLGITRCYNQKDFFLLFSEQKKKCIKIRLFNFLR